ncbi:MAG: hypothetical protein M3O09_17890 [Acidobacteriota bacterium]|nr:hypothetical protein [Acidobacteriota bacterium]
MRRIGRWLTLYLSVAFIALIPIMSYHVVRENQPKKILLLVIPCYVLLAWSFYAGFKTLKPK